jgi:hypothetical protein
VDVDGCWKIVTGIRILKWWIKKEREGVTEGGDCLYNELGNARIDASGGNLAPR